MKKVVANSPLPVDVVDCPYGNYILSGIVTGSIYNPALKKDDTRELWRYDIPFKVVDVGNFYFEHGNGD